MNQLFSKPQYEVCRSAGDFTWLHTALLDSCPERIIPPLTPPVSLDGEYTLPPSLSSILQSLLLATVSEYQRFLSRISNHRVLRCNHHVVTFLTASPEVTPPPLYTDQSYCSYYRSCVQFVLNSIAMSRVRWCIVLPRGGIPVEGHWSPLNTTC